MNILYVSHLSGLSFAGPTYSVPKQIFAQSKIDNVFWYNAVNLPNSEWKKLLYYHDIVEYPKESILDLPSPFNKPDIIVVESFYNMAKSPLILELITLDIPYIIVPRGELTKQGQSHKRIKKEIANIIICNRFAKKAAAIQYLTKQELKDSGKKWNTRFFVIPNGIDSPTTLKNSFSSNGIKCVMIGRIEAYQKGIDMLIKACSEIREDLISNDVSIDIYGPDKYNSLPKLVKLIQKYKLEDIVLFHEGVFENDKEKVLLENDVYFMPSRFEGHPMALIEALSYGLPVLVTTGSNMKEEIQNSNSGWTANNDPESLKNAILLMIEDKDSFKIKSKNAITLSRKYNWEKIARITHENLALLIDDKKK